MNERLFTPCEMGLIRLPNRIVMAPLTRRRAENAGLVPNDIMCAYYSQRATAGLIISEGSQISPVAYGYTHTPGCYTEEQLEGWKRVTRSVHQAGGRIFLQLWHVGPFSHRLLQPGGMAPVSASSVIPEGEVLTGRGRVPYEASRAMTINEISSTVKDFGTAAGNAVSAGFDGVEIHGAHAYLIDQFIMDGTNRRNDDYGGSLQNRCRLLFEVIEEVLSKVPAGRVGLRLSPGRVKAGMGDSHPTKTYGYIMEKLNNYPLAYLHLSEFMTQEERIKDPGASFVPYYRKIYHGTIISCGGHSLESARLMLDKGEADLIAFGKPYISNPDLAERLRKGAPLEPPDKDTFYHGGPKGYIDYPVYNESDRKE